MSEAFDFEGEESSLRKMHRGTKFVVDWLRIGKALHRAHAAGRREGLEEAMEHCENLAFHSLAADFDRLSRTAKKGEGKDAD